MIATEKGWNLYVGGNGGCHPAPRRPARRATSTTTTLIRYIDRFLMYYIRTADRLQRTAPLDRDARGRPRPPARRDRRRLARHRRRAGGGDGAARRHLPRRVGGHPRRPGEAAPVRLVRQRPGHPRPDHHLRAPSATRSARGRGRAGAAAAHRSRWVRREHRGTRGTTAGCRCADRDLEVERGVAALVRRRRRSRSSAPTTTSVYALGNYDPFAGPRCCPAASSAPAATCRSWPRRCTSRPSTCAPASASTTPTVSVPTYDVRWSGRRGAGRPPQAGARDATPARWAASGSG